MRILIYSQSYRTSQDTSTSLPATDASLLKISQTGVLSRVQNAQFIHQRLKFQQKLPNYWQTATKSCQNDARALWSEVPMPMTPPPQRDSCRLSAIGFAAYFSLKVESIRAAAASALVPTIEAISTVPPLSSFTPIKFC
jgi:hypothetical protein